MQGHLLSSYTVHRRRQAAIQGMTHFSTTDLFKEMSGDTGAEMEKSADSEVRG